MTVARRQNMLTTMGTLESAAQKPDTDDAAFFRQNKPIAIIATA